MAIFKNVQISQILGAGEKYAGGIGGHLNGGTIADCANYGDIKGTYIGGIVGFVSQDDGSTCSDK